MIRIKKHLESNMLDDEDKADHEASDAAHPSQEPEEGIDVHAAWEGPVNHKSKLSDRGKGQTWNSPEESRYGDIDTNY